MTTACACCGPKAGALGVDPVVATCRLDLLGRAVEVEVTGGGAEHIHELLTMMPVARVHPDRSIRCLRRPGEPVSFDLLDGNRLVRGGMNGPEAVRTLLWSLNQLALGTRSHVILHAGAVALGDCAVVLPAPADAGKSTLVAALLGRGWEYLSDEFAPIDLGDECLRPYCSPLGLDSGSFGLFPELRPRCPPELTDEDHWNVRPSRCRLEPAKIGAIVFPRYEQDAACSLTALQPVDALHCAAGEALNLFELGRPAFAALSDLVRGTPSYAMVFSDLDEACDEDVTMIVELGVATST